jgi:hypothetical protein
MSEELRRELAKLSDEAAFKYFVNRLTAAFERARGTRFEFGDLTLSVHKGELAKIEARPKVRIYSNRDE